MQKKFNIVVLLALIFALDNSYAAKEVTFRQQTHVYSKKSDNSEVLGVYDRGDTVPISDKTYGPWRKVIVDVDGKKKVGWVLAKDIRGTKVKDSAVRKKPEAVDRGAISSYRKKTGVGLMGNLSYVYQSKGDITFDVGGTPQTAQYSSLSGANVFLGIFGDYNYSKTTAVRGYLAMRNIKRSGVAEVQGGSGNFTLTHDLISLGTTIKFYSSTNAIFWWGPGLEIAKTTKYSVQGSSGALTIEGEVSDDPIYALVTLSAGYDLNISERFFILPEVKLGVVPNGDPMAITLEILIPIALTF